MHTTQMTVVVFGGMCGCMCGVSYLCLGMCGCVSVVSYFTLVYARVCCFIFVNGMSGCVSGLLYICAGMCSMWV